MTIKNITHNLSSSIKRFYILHLVRIGIVSLFAAYIISGIRELKLDYEITNFTIFDYFDPFLNRSYFRPSIILLIPFLGVFINNKVGWTLITSYFYFFFFNTLFSFIHEILNNPSDSILFLIISLLPLLMIVLMNIPRISYSAYKIHKSQLGNTNTAAILIGMSLVILLAMDIAKII